MKFFLRHILSRLHSRSPEAPEIPPVPSPLSLRKLLTGVLSKALPVAQARNISLTLVGDADAQVTCSAAGFSGLLQLLLDGIATEKHAGNHVELSILNETGRVQLIIQDDTPGIYPDNYAKIFSSIYCLPRADLNAIKDQVSHLGLKLTRSARPDGKSGLCHVLEFPASPALPAEAPASER